MNNLVRLLIAIELLALLFSSVTSAQGPLASGETGNGAIAGAGELDSWTFAANNGDNIVLRIGELIDHGNFDPMIQLYAPGGALIDSKSGPQATEIAVTASNSGTFTVLVSDGPSGGLGSTGTYQLHLAIVPGAFVVADDGGPLDNGGNHDGTIHSGDLDLWSFAASTGDKIVLRVGELSDHGNFDPLIRLYAPDGTLLDSESASQAAEIAVTASNSGTFTVLISDGPSGGLGSTGTYRLHLAMVPGVFVVADDGGPLTNGGNHDGTIDSGDLDQWSFVANTGDKIVLRVGELSDHGNFDPLIRLYAPDSTLLDSKSASQAAEIAVTAPNSGMLTVLVSDGPSGGLGSTGTYRLHLAMVPGDFVVADDGGPLTNGGNHDGTIDSGDLDLWTFTAAIGDRIVLRVGELTDHGNFDPLIRLYGADAVLLDSKSGFQATEIAVTAPNSGTFTVLVSDGPSGGLGSTGTYRLTIFGITQGPTPPPTPTIPMGASATPTSTANAGVPTATRTAPSPTPTVRKAFRLAYYALGDSIASGHGLPSGLGQLVGTCQTSPEAYPGIVLNDLRQRLPDSIPVLRHLACTGAQTFQRAAAPPLTDLPDQVARILQIAPAFGPTQVTLVSITAGADDLDFVNELLAGSNLCAEDSVFEQWVETATLRVRLDVGRQLVQLLQANERLYVVVTDYPNPLPRESGFFELVRWLARLNPTFGLVGTNPRCSVQSNLKFHTRVERAIGLLNKSLSLAVTDTVARTGAQQRVRFVQIHDLFRGHEGPGGPCGPYVFPTESETYVQFSFLHHLTDFTLGDLLIHSNPAEYLFDLIRHGDDCIHPNEDGATVYAHGAGSAPGVSNAAIALLSNGFSADAVENRAEPSQRRGGVGRRAPAASTELLSVGECCVATDQNGCQSASCQACVCEADDFCCETGWDEFCATSAKGQCAPSCPCGTPNPSNTPTPTPTPGGDCCASHAGPGCEEASCKVCVCGIDSDCCDGQWDGFCVLRAARECSSSCACSPPTPTSTSAPTPGGSCCADHSGPGCSPAACETCVCNIDSECCTSAWNDFCLQTVSGACAQDCGCEPTPTVTPPPSQIPTATPAATAVTPIPTPTRGGDCSSAHPGPGCDSSGCQLCVCGADAFCCTFAWDASCLNTTVDECSSICAVDSATPTPTPTPFCTPPPCPGGALVCPVTCPGGCSIQCVTASPTASLPSPTPTPRPCIGDCNSTGDVTVNELIIMVNIALGNSEVSACPVGDINANGAIEINEIITAVNNALNGCQ